MTNPEDMAGLVEKAVEAAIKRLGQVNVLIVGRTGVGKSTLINAMFQGEIAATGQGRPVTTGTREYTKEGLPLTIWDTTGFELGAHKEIVADLEKHVLERKGQDPDKHIHVAWLCILEDGRRVEAAEVEFCKALAKHMTVIGVITKARADQGFGAVVQRELSDTKQVVRVRAVREEGDDGHVLEPMGLIKLLDATNEVIPEARRNALAAAQRVSIEHKKKRAHKVVIAAAGTAALEGASPIPFSDAFLLVPTQVGMLAGISTVFGLELSTAFLRTLVASVAGSTTSTIVGRMIVSNVLKMIPGAGTLIGGGISGTIAAAITTTLGEAYIATLAFLFAKYDGKAPAPEEVASELKRRIVEKVNQADDSGAGAESPDILNVG